MNQGQLPAARKAFLESNRLAEALADLRPDDEQLAFERAQTRFWLGQVDFNQGKNAAALENFRGYLAIAEAWSARQPESTRWQMEVAYAASSLATLLDRQNAKPEAEELLQRSIAIKRRLVEQDPGNPEWRRSLANGLAWLGKLQLTEGRMAAAAATWQAELELSEKLAAADGKSAALSLLAVNLGNLGDLLVDLGELERGVQLLRRQAELAERLATQDPANRDWQRDLAAAWSQLAGALMLQGEAREAAILVRRADRALAALVALDPTNEEWQIQKAHAEVAQAGLSLAAGAPAAALAAAEQAIGRCAPLLAGRRKSLFASQAAGLARLAAGQAHQASGRPAAAQGMARRPGGAVAMDRGNPPAFLPRGLAPGPLPSRPPRGSDRGRRSPPGRLRPARLPGSSRRNFGAFTVPITARHRGGFDGFDDDHSEFSQHHFLARVRQHARSFRCRRGARGRCPRWRPAAPQPRLEAPNVIDGNAIAVSILAIFMLDNATCRYAWYWNGALLDGSARPRPGSGPRPWPRSGRPRIPI